MADTSIDVAYVAQLARLEIDPAQTEKLRRELGDIVSYIAKLDEVDVSGVEPTVHALSRSNVWREDVAKDSFPREKMLANAPETIGGDLIKVPQVLPGEGSN
ncbi:MAG: Asp-tRNA(Asn)/Glu-tRNA(Gln) amidotransferase subunit GatC [Victivallaceae bacterium]|nr:Asp-tRNA(Asn)/Glu-tRNA(Gln) amidotransferase subunit GatC [Victivallaceae bacterium]